MGSGTYEPLPLYIHVSGESSKTKQMNTTDDALIRTYVTTRIAEKRKCKKNNKMVPCNKVINICLITT